MVSLRSLKGVQVFVGCVAALVVAALVVSRGPGSRPNIHLRPLPEPVPEEYGLVLPPSELAFDNLRNTSRMTDDELRYCFEGLMESRMVELLDQDQDGVADGTLVEVKEFIQRMKIILSDRAPFVYRVTPQGLPIMRATEL